MSERTIIVGGGVVGLAVAYALARRGAGATVLDDTDLTVSASTGNAGIVALGHAPLPRPGLVLQGLRMMLDRDSPLYFPLRFDAALLRWMWEFRRACRPDVFDRSMRILAALGHAAGGHWRSLLESESIECHAVPNGWIDVYRGEKAAGHGALDTKLLRGAGYTVMPMSRREVLDAEPAFDGSIIGGTRYVDGVFLHPGEFLRELADRAARHGALIRTGTTVRRIDHDGSTVAAVETTSGERVEGASFVLAAGAWTTPLAKSIGVRVPMEAGKGYHVNLPRLDPPLGTACVLADRHIAVTPMGAITRLAGTVELSGLNLELRARRVEMLAEGALEYLPGVAGLEASPGWCGLRPCTADGLPVLGRAPRYGNLYIATGHARYGLTLGPISGKLLAELILDGRSSLDVEALSPGRF